MLLALYAMDVFLDAHKEQLPAAASSGTRVRFAHALAQLELHVHTQAASPIVSKGLTRAKDAKREALLRDFLAPVVRIARLEATVHPALASLKMPRGEPGLPKLLAHAAGIASVAQDYRNVFVAAGMRPGFLEELNAAIDEILTTLTARTKQMGAGAGATRGLQAALATCNRYKAVLDAFVRREAGTNVPLLEHWESVRRVGRVQRRRSNVTLREAARSRPSLAAAATPIRDVSRLLSASSLPS